MTCIVQGYATKKALRTAVAAGLDVTVTDPSIFKPRTFYVSDMIEGQSEVVTNHPKRSWFAKIERKGGKLRVT